MLEGNPLGEGQPKDKLMLRRKTQQKKLDMQRLLRIVNLNRREERHGEKAQVQRSTVVCFRLTLASRRELKNKQLVLEKLSFSYYRTEDVSANVMLVFRHDTHPL